MRITLYDTLLNEDKHCDLVKVKSMNYPNSNYLYSSYGVCDILCKLFQMDKKTEEHVYLVCLNAKGKVLGVFEVFHGVVNGSYYQPREILQRALLCNASSIIAAHNHPSGDPTPSVLDRTSHQKLKMASELIGINLVDSLIIGDNNYFSFADEAKESED